MASGWNLWVWLECIGVVSGCCFKEVYIIDILIIIIIIKNIERARKFRPIETSGLRARYRVTFQESCS